MGLLYLYLDIRLFGRYTQRVKQGSEGKNFRFTAPYTVRAVVFDTNEFYMRSARLSVGNVLQKRQKKLRE